MIITRTPYRISFFGGGTDYPDWYRVNGGAVLSATINKYCYVTARYLPPFFRHKHRIVYSRQENVSSVDEINHPAVRETIRFSKIKHGLEIHHDGDVPAMSGLGTSSSFTVGLLNALAALEGKLKSKRELALDAIHIEQNMIKERVGSQDQTAAAFGGLNRIGFGGPQKIMVQPVVMPSDRIKELENHLLLFFTELPRNASKIAAEQIKKIPAKTAELTTLHQAVDEGLKILQSNQSLDEFGRLLDATWKIKRTLGLKITSPKIDAIYRAGCQAGALGGKLLGAGAGGFMLFYVPPERQTTIKKRLQRFITIPVRFEYNGSQIIYAGREFEEF